MQYPFQQICADYFTLEGREYLVIVDRYSRWPGVHLAKDESSKEMINNLKLHCETFGVPEVLTSNGGSQFVSKETQDFLDIWGIKHRLNSAYNPHGNTRAELGVKSMKRLIRDNLGPGGSLDNTAFSRALLTYRNTTDPDTGRSLAQVIFGRSIRDFIPVGYGNYKPRKEWLLTQQEREKALAKRHLATKEALTKGTKTQIPLTPGTMVTIQNQRGPRQNKWDHLGVVVESLGNSQYKVKVDGSGLNYRALAMPNRNAYDS